MKVIGITGGVGAGKSEVMHYLETVCDSRILLADQAAHSLMEPDGACFAPVLQVFGRETLSQNGTFDRQKLAERIFRQPELREQMNGIVHPAVKQYILREIAAEREKGRGFFFLEAALLIEEKYDEICDELWYVYSEESVRRARLKESRQYSEEKISRMMESQLSEQEFRAHCAFVLDNSGSFAHTAAQIRQRMEQYEAM